MNPEFYGELLTAVSLVLVGVAVLMLALDTRMERAARGRREVLEQHMQKRSA